MKRSKYWSYLGILGIGLAIVLCLSPWIGSSSIDWRRVFDSSLSIEENRDAAILFQLRIPRVLLAAIVGAALSAAGVVLQALLRNFLATPFTLGISSGASLGAVIALEFGFSASFWGISPVSFAAALGAAGSAFLVFWLGRSRDGLDSITLILSGIIVNFFLSAVILFFHYLANPYQSFQITRWMMGSLDILGYESLLGAAILIGLGIFPMLLLSRDLNLLSIGEEEAQSLGVDLKKTRWILFVASSLVTGAAVAIAGPIGFVGLIVPHALRLAFGPDNVFLLPASLLAGASFLVLCDDLSRSLTSGTELPVGVFTAFLGCPFFIWLLKRNRKDLVFPG